MHQNGELKAFLHSLDPGGGDEDGQTDNPLAGARPDAGVPVRCRVCSTALPKCRRSTLTAHEYLTPGSGLLQVDALAEAAARHKLEAEAVTANLAAEGVQRSDEVMDVEEGGGGLDAPGTEDGPPDKKGGCPCTIM